MTVLIVAVLAAVVVALLLASAPCMTAQALRLRPNRRTSTTPQATGETRGARASNEVTNIVHVIGEI